LLNRIMTALATHPSPLFTPDSVPQYPADSIFVDYVVSGERSAAAVLKGTSTLCELIVVAPDGTARRITADFAAALNSYGSNHRVYYDALFARAVETRNALPGPSTFDDLRIALHLLNENEDWDYVRFTDHVRESYEGAEFIPGASPMDPMAPAQLIRRYVEQRRPLATIEDQGLDFVYRHIELPLVEPVSAMQRRGLPVDPNVLGQIRDEYTTKTDIARQQVCEIVGCPLNLNSYPEVSTYLYRTLRLPVLVRTDNGNPAIDDAALTALEGQHPVIQSLRRYRAAKVVYDAANALERQIVPGESRIVPRLDPQGATTGRFTCREPNLQALPPELLPAIRAREGYMLIEADFSQIELRVLAELSRDESLVEAFRSNADIHARTASYIYGVDERYASAAQRDMGKAVNFGIIFGQSAFSLAEQLGMWEHEMDDFIYRFFCGYRGVSRWIREIETVAARDGYSLTHYCRRRRPAGLGRGFASRGILRQTVNAVIQGTAADIMKMALVRAHQALPAGCSLLLTVHDSLLVEVPSADVDEAAAVLRQATEFPPPEFAVPLKVTIRSGRTWAECKEAGHAMRLEMADAA
jgi:DNA polymerase-1